MRTNLLALFIPFIRLQLDVERLMYILAFNPVLFKLKLYVILNLALLTLARIKFSPLFAFARWEFTDDRFKRIFITKNKTISDGGITVDFSIIKVHTSN